MSAYSKIVCYRLTTYETLNAIYILIQLKIEIVHNISKNGRIVAVIHVVLNIMIQIMFIISLLRRSSYFTVILLFVYVIYSLTCFKERFNA